jgi:hypothetical protein
MFGFRLPWRHPYHHWHAVFVVQGVAVYLTPEETTHMAVTLAVGHTLNMAVGFLDQHGNPMLTAPTPDSPPGWTNTTPATETIAPAADGLTCVGTPVAAGSDQVSLSLAVGGVSFTASLDVTVTAEAQVLTSVAINATVA